MVNSKNHLIIQSIINQIITNHRIITNMETQAKIILSKKITIIIITLKSKNKIKIKITTTSKTTITTTRTVATTRIKTCPII